MTRYFFDFTTRDRSLFDYRGDEFLSSRAACEYAEMIASDLKHRPDGEWSGWSVEVRSIEGKKILALPVGSAEPLAA